MGRLDNFVICAYCNGRGRDPFDIMSEESTCVVCRGRGDVRCPEPRVECAYCSGTGRQPHKRLTCGGCGGKGAHTVKKPHARCPVCEGTGCQPGDEKLTCVRCRGAGALPAKTAARVTA